MIRRTGLAIWLVVPVAFAAGVAVSKTSNAPAVANAAAADAPADPATILAARSPGERPDGALTQTKPSRVAPGTRVAAANPFTPTERVLSGERVRPPAATTATGDPAPIGDTPTTFASAPPAFVGGLPRVDPVGGAPINGGGGQLPPGGGGGILPPNQGPFPPTTPPPVAAVPEPSSWATMIIGFFAIGGMLRRRASDHLPTRDAADRS
jgi:hypothetical protein